MFPKHKYPLKQSFVFKTPVETFQIYNPSLLHIKDAAHAFKCMYFILSHDLAVLRKICVTFFWYPTMRVEYS